MGMGKRERKSGGGGKRHAFLAGVRAPLWDSGRQRMGSGPRPAQLLCAFCIFFFLSALLCSFAVRYL